MRRFDYDDNNEEYRREVDKFFGGYGDESEITPEEYDEIIREEQAYNNLQYKLVKQELNHRIMRTAIRMAENSFWWKFYSHDTKLNVIDKVYKKIKNLEEQPDADV